MIRWFEPVAILCIFQVKRNNLMLTDSLVCVGTLRLNRKIVLKTGQQKRLKLASEPINLAERPMFQKVQEKPLGQILCVMR
jgi:hypothetical protein